MDVDGFWSNLSQERRGEKKGREGDRRGEKKEDKAMDRGCWVLIATERLPGRKQTFVFKSFSNHHDL